jgi:hypothetical protein
LRAREAHAFCDALRAALITALPGYRAAPWEWTPQRVAQARAAQFSS